MICSWLVRTLPMMSGVLFPTSSAVPNPCSKAEWQLEGGGPWEQLGPDVQLIFTPGHTAGCVSLLYQPAKALFTGDHLFVSSRKGRLTICR